MYDLITIGNISVDLYFKGESLTFHDNRFQFAIGGKYFSDTIVETLGGSGANVAIGARKNGLESAVFGQIGNNSFKSMILEALKSESVSSKICQFVDHYHCVSCILLTGKGERSIIHYSTPHQHIVTEENHKHLLDTRSVFFGNLQHVSLTEKKRAIHFLKKNQIKIYLNLGVVDCRRDKSEIKDLLEHIDILLLNGHEFADLVKKDYCTIDFKVDIIDKYLSYMKQKIVVVTEGKKGSYAYYQNRIYHVKSEYVENLVDTTGAGDAYCAGFSSEYLKHQSIEKAMEKGSKYASIIIQKIGAN